jgi:hypothetical protein
MDAYTVWLRVCDWIAAYWTEGSMTDDFPEYDWRGAYEWGDDPVRAVRGAIGVYTSLEV